MWKQVHPQHYIQVRHVLQHHIPPLFRLTALLHVLVLKGPPRHCRFHFIHMHSQITALWTEMERWNSIRGAKMRCHNCLPCIMSMRHRLISRSEHNICSSFFWDLTNKSRQFVQCQAVTMSVIQTPIYCAHFQGQMPLCCDRRCFQAYRKAEPHRHSF